MDENTDPVDTVATVLDNYDLLVALDGTTMDKHELGDAVGVSEQTIYRRTRELRDLGLVTRSPDEYELTPLGTLFAELLRETVDVASVLAESESMLDHLSDPPPLSAVRDADVVTPFPHAPNHPIRVLDELLADAADLRAVSPVVLPEYVEMIEENVAERGLAGELLLDTSVVEYLKQWHADDVSTLLTATDFAVHRTTVDASVGIILVDEPTRELATPVYGDQGELRGMLHNDAEAAVAWGEQLYERYRDRSDGPLAESAVPISPE